jgi:hypothetical protein
MDRTNSKQPSFSGHTQLSLVEHALCPLDARFSLRRGFSHQTSYRLTNAHGERQVASVRVDCSRGLSAGDEFYLWGLLALTFAQQEPSPEFYATPHYCLRELGVIEPGSKGGKSYRLFRESLSRLAGVRYENNLFFDPVRKEHRQVSFGLLGYSLPLDPLSSRAWRIVWDTQFFEICQAEGGRLRFDLALYRRLDPATRRLLLLLLKVFYRRKKSPRFGLRELTINTLGFSDQLSNTKLKAKLKRAGRLLRLEGVIAGDIQFGRRGESYFVEFHRGPLLEQGSGFANSSSLVESPLIEPLTQIGLEMPDARRILKKYRRDLVRVWCDVTLVAMEKRDKGFFRRSPAAYFINNLQAASRGERTPPDWFLAVQKQEERRRAETARPRPKDSSSKLSLALNPKLSGRELVAEMTAQFQAAGQSLGNAKRNAELFAKTRRTHS